MTEDRDPLLTLADVARRLGVSTATIERLVHEGMIPSLDRGRLGAKDGADVPLVRQSALDRVRKGWSRRETTRLDIGSPLGEHPAVMVALDFLEAVRTGDEERLARLSTDESQQELAGSRELLGWWKKQLGGDLDALAVATGIYPIAGADTVVAIRLVDHALPFPMVVTEPTVIIARAVLPVRKVGENWLVDRLLFEKRHEWEEEAGLIQRQDG